MANVHVDYQELRTTASQLQKGQDEITGQLSRLKSMIDSLVASGFVTDQASGKFQESYRQWDSGAKSVIQGLEGMNGFLTRAVDQHEQLDSQLGQAASA